MSKNNNFSKINIKAGYVLEFQNGSLAIITYNADDELCYAGDHVWGNVSDLNKFCGSKEVIAVYGRCKYNSNSYKPTKDGRLCLWKRVEPKKMTLEEIEKLLGYEIEII